METLLQLLEGEKSMTKPMVRYMALAGVYAIGIATVLLLLRSL